MILEVTDLGPRTSIDLFRYQQFDQQLHGTMLDAVKSILHILTICFTISIFKIDELLITITNPMDLISMTIIKLKYYMLDLGNKLNTEVGPIAKIT